VTVTLDVKPQVRPAQDPRLTLGGDTGPARAAYDVDLDAHVRPRRRPAGRSMGSAHRRQRREPARRPVGRAAGLRSGSVDHGARVTAVVIEREPTAAELEQTPLAHELELVRELLEAFGDGRPPARVATPRPAATGFEPAVDRLARFFGLSPFERQLLLLAAAVELDGDIAALAREPADGTTRGRRSASRSPRCRGRTGTRSRRVAAPPRRLLEPAPGRRWRAGRSDRRANPPLPRPGSTRPTQRLDGCSARTVRPRARAVAERLAEELARHARRAGARVSQARRRRRGRASAWRHARAGARPHCPRRARAALPAAGPELAGPRALVDREAAPRRTARRRRRRRRAPSTRSSTSSRRRSSSSCGEGTPRPGGRAAPSRRPAAVAGRGRALWTAALGEPRSPPDGVEELAQHFRLGAAASTASRASSATRADGDTAATLRRLCRERARVALEGLAERIDPVATLGRPRAADGHLELLREIVRHVRHRRRSTSAGASASARARPRRHARSSRARAARARRSPRKCSQPSSGSTSTASTSPRP
jgi:hypothetical protein